MSRSEQAYEPQISRLAFVIAGISFIPLLGVPFGIVPIVWGLSRLDAGSGTAALIGVMGIGFTTTLSPSRGRT